MDSTPSSPKHTEAHGLLRRIQAALDAGDPQGALSLIDTRHSGDRYLDNARGVCLLRLGRLRPAVELYRRIVLAEGSMELRPGLPVVIATNYATALLLEQNVDGCLALLRQLHQDEHPSVLRLRDTVERWREGLGRWERLQFRLYGIMKRPIVLDGLPGELVLPGPEAPRRAA